MAQIFGTLVGGGLSQPIEAVGKVLDKLFTSDDEKLTREEALTRLAQAPELAQIELNRVEAAHRTVFVAGWRPFVGWVCGAALAYNFILRDLIAWLMAIAAPPTVPLPPALQMEHLITVLLGLLGLGTLRTVEKIGRAAK
jgi:hypothetical protein